MYGYVQFAKRARNSCETKEKIVTVKAIISANTLCEQLSAVEDRKLFVL
jgi:hypothetical protein